MQDTKWEDISGLSGIYQVSNNGLVKRELTGKILKPFLIQGYPTVDLRDKNYSVHRLVAIQFKENPENKPQVNHIDCIKTNNNEWNLEWATGSENAKHAVANGLFHPLLPGEDSYSAKLNNIQVFEIRAKYAIVKSSRKLAREYGVTKSTILRILNGESWSHI